MNKETQRQEELQQAIETPENFFRDVEIEFLIHELKDPLAIIETGLRTLLERQDKYGSLEPRQEKTLKRTLRNSKKARQMLNNLLEIGRSEAGCFISCRFQPARSAYQALIDSLETVAGTVFEEFRNYDSESEAIEFLAKSGVLFEVDPQAANVEIVQDEVKFRQIIGNLIKNALHHRKKRIEIKIGLDQEQLVSDVIDDGPGIDPEHHDLIFKRYAQVKECSLVPRKGHGLGLAGALILARTLGGDIKIRSELGKGATFRLTLPLNLDSVQT
jgi:signal transduction histidine kinase